MVFFSRRPRFLCKRRIVVLDLRPLQCGYAGKGIGRYTLEMATRIARALRDSPRFKVHCLALAGEAPPLPDIPVKFFAPKLRRVWIWDQTILPLLLLWHRVHVFHNFVAMGPLADISFPVLYGGRSIVTLHDWHMFASDASPVERFYRTTKRIRIQRKGLVWVRHLAAVSEWTKRETASLTGINPRWITVLPNGGDHLHDSAAEAAGAEAIDVGGNNAQPFVLSIGDTPNKNLAFAFHVMTAARDKMNGAGHPLRWVVVGQRQRIAEQLQLVAPEIDASHLPEWIIVLESPSDAHLIRCYLRAACLLFPSAREGFGIPILEAMHLGCPVLAADAEPMRSLLGYPPGLLPLADADAWANTLSHLQQSPEKRQAAIAHGKQRAQGFTWDQTVAKLLPLYG